MENNSKELKTRILDLEAALEEYTDKDSIARLLLSGDNYDKCSHCGAILPLSELRKIRHMDGDDVEVELLCENC